jgi:hypothetical protein
MTARSSLRGERRPLSRLVSIGRRNEPFVDLEQRPLRVVTHAALNNVTVCVHHLNTREVAPHTGQGSRSSSAMSERSSSRRPQFPHATVPALSDIAASVTACAIPRDNGPRPLERHAR